MLVLSMILTAAANIVVIDGTQITPSEVDTSTLDGFEMDGIITGVAGTQGVLSLIFPARPTADGATQAYVQFVPLISSGSGWGATATVTVTLENGKVEAAIQNVTVSRGGEPDHVVSAAFLEP